MYFVIDMKFIYGGPTDANVKALFFVSRATYQATDWFFNHLAGIIPIVMVTRDRKVIPLLLPSLIKVRFKLLQCVVWIWRHPIEGHLRLTF